MSFVSASQNSGPTFTCSIPGVGDTTGNVSCSIATLANGASANFTVVLHIASDASPGTTITNVATVTSGGPDFGINFDPNDENNSSSASVTTPGLDQADLSVTKSGPLNAGANTDVTFSISVENSGPNNAQTVSLSDTLPGNMTFVSWSQDSGPVFSCAPLPTVGSGGTVNCSISMLNAGQSASFTLIGHIPGDASSGTQYVNNATVSSTTSDPNNENNIGTAGVQVSAVDVSVVKTGPATGTVGNNITWTITTANAGPDIAQNVVLSDSLPSGTTFVSLTQDSGPTADCTFPPVGANGTVTCTFTALGSGVTNQFTLTAFLTPSIPNGTVLNNTATIATSEFDTNQSNNSSTQATTITNTIVNQPPNAVDDSLSSVAEDSGTRTITIASLMANDSAGPPDESSQTLTFSLISGSAVGGTVTSDATNVYFTPTANFNGPASFQYQITDNGMTNGSPDLKSDTATVSFDVTEVNDAPAAVNDTLTNVAEDSGQRTIPFSALTGNDSKGPANESGQTLIVKTVSNPVGGTVSIVGGNVLFTPTADYFGPASFDYTAEDNGTTNGVADAKTSGTATVSFTITEVNDPPTAVNDTLSNVSENSGQRTIPFATLTANDSKGPANESTQTLSVKTVGNAVGGTVGLVGGNVLFTTAADYNGPASFDYTVEDNGTTNGVSDPKTSGPATVSFNISDVNEAPVAVNDPLGNLTEDAPQRTIPFSALTGNDSPGANESGQTLIVKTVSNPVGVTVSIVAGTVRITPLPDYNGPASFQYTVEDNGTTNGAPDPKTSAPALAHFNITEVNDAPTAVNDTLTNVAEDSGQRTIPFSTLTANDLKGPANESSQTLTVKTVGNPVGGTVSIVAGNVVFTPTANYFGPASFDYTVEDNGTTNGVADPKTSGPATVTFANSAVADTPSVTNATTNANTQTTSGLVISRNPADGAEVTHFKITAISGGTLFKNDGVTPINNGDFITFAEGNAGLKFTPGTTNGSFTVQASLSASDAGLGGGTVTATIIVNPLGGVIRFSAASYSVAEGAGFRTITVERSGDTSQAVTVDYASSDDSATANFIPCNSPGTGQASSRCDFTTALGTLRFAAGETSKTFNVLIGNDNYVEGPETLDLTLSNATNGAVFGVPQTAILTITDDLTEPATNPIDNAADFVKAQYHDVLNREPDAAGLAFWTDNIEKCNDPARRPAGQTVAQCIDKQRESTAIAFFMSPEFQMTGGFVYHLYKGSLTGTPNYDGGSPGRFPTFLEFMRDMGQVSEGIVVNGQISGAVVEANRNALATAFVQRPEFVAKYGGLNDTLFVQELFNTTGIAATAVQKQALVDGLTNATETRASVLRKVVDGTVVVSESNVQFTTPYGQAFINQENRRLFVYLEYVGYLRRNPDTAGFVFWLGKLNQYNGDPFQAEMVRSFILSPEYRSRFGQP
jgi:uncharacterized repeat protein (TIGR01451 family)